MALGPSLRPGQGGTCHSQDHPSKAINRILLQPPVPVVSPRVGTAGSPAQHRGQRALNRRVPLAQIWLEIHLRAKWRRRLRRPPPNPRLKTGLGLKLSDPPPGGPRPLSRSPASGRSTFSRRPGDFPSPTAPQLCDPGKGCARGPSAKVRPRDPETPK
ncbi:unnamed protein product [Rangifer tarandus platyrhynchus]|uniref:Uncharacterized protein n=1 Tax=Rangifer tarandus platyrhynchus TaxID=3082113 RepID=A0ABN8Y8A2_RANTA|nr:unnamed protein product [Rangifer tarandus platyrhynchus]